MSMRMSPIRVAVLVGLLVSFCGCDRKKEEVSPTVKVAVPQWFYPSAERPWLETFWSKLDRESPNARLEVVLYPGKTEQVLHKLLAVQASGDGPDLACVRMHWLGLLREHGLVQPMDGMIRHEIRSQVIPALSTEPETSGAVSPNDGKGRDPGPLYLLPYDVGVRLILYRADLFAKAGLPVPGAAWNQSDFLMAARKLTVDRNGDGTPDQWGMGIPGARSEKTVFQWLPWFWNLGGSFFPDGGDVPSISTPAANQAMDWYGDLAWREKVTPPTLYSMDQDGVFQGLAGGYFAMTEGGSWEPALLKEFSQFHDQIGLAPMPVMISGKPATTLLDGWGFVLLRNDPARAECIRTVLEALSSPEHQFERFQAAGLLSPFRALYRDPRFLATAQSDVLAAAVKSARPMPDFARFPLVVAALEAAIQDVLFKRETSGAALTREQERLVKRFEKGSETPRARRPVPPGSLRISDPANGREEIVSRASIETMKRQPVGDMELIDLAEFFPGTSGGEALVTAADGFEKTVSLGRPAVAWLDPRSMTVYVVRTGRKPFGVRDVVEIVLQGTGDVGGLVIAVAGGKHVLTAQRLTALADNGVVSFPMLLASAGLEAPRQGDVVLFATDGYSRKVPVSEFLKGNLLLEGMHCRFPGRPSRDQVSLLERIEMP